MCPVKYSKYRREVERTERKILRGLEILTYLLSVPVGLYVLYSFTHLPIVKTIYHYAEYTYIAAVYLYGLLASYRLLSVYNLSTRTNISRKYRRRRYFPGED